MDAAQRATLVREARIEIKQERQQQARGWAMLSRASRVQRRVNSEADRIGKGVRRRVDAVGDRVGAAAEGALRAYSRHETRRLRRINMRESARIRTEGYDITPEFRRRSAEVGERATATGFRARAGSGSNRWRGAVRQIHDESGSRVTEARRTAAILAERERLARRSNTPVLDQDPGSYSPARRERAPRGTMTTRNYRRARRVQHTTD